MPRKYDASRRQEAAQQTRDDIVATAIRLHGRGILDYEDLAREANVSLSTVRKYFPSLDSLFERCVAVSVEEAPFPDLQRLASEAMLQARIRIAVQELQGFYEALLGQFWQGYRNPTDSAIISGAIAQLETLAEEASGILTAVRDEKDAEGVRGFVTGLLSFLTYRALRVQGRLSPEQAEESVVKALTGALEASVKEEAAV